MYNYLKTRHSTSSESETPRPLMQHYYYQEPPVNPIHMQAYGVNPQYHPPSYPPHMQETYKNYYEPPRTPDTQYFTPHYQDTSTACESEVEHDKIPHRRKRNQRKPRTQPSQLNGSIPNNPRQFEPLQPTMPTSPRQFQFHPQPGRKAGCHREKTNNRTNTPKEKVEDREFNNGNGSYDGNISQIMTTIHFLCLLCATILCLSMLPPYGATL